jgi:hypothetical protein
MKDAFFRFLVVIVVLTEISFSFLQIKNVTNLSLYRSISSESVSWTYDAPVNLVFENYPDAPFWYADGEQKASDLIASEDSITLQCGNNVGEFNWHTGWPSTSSVELSFFDRKCLKAPLRIPAHWISASHEVSYVRDSKTLDLIVVNKSEEDNLVLRLNYFNPLFIGMYISVFTILSLVFIKSRVKKFYFKKN